MKSKIFILSIAFILDSCSQSNVKIIEQFPYSENELIEENFGILLEYAIFDSTKIDFVKSLICDSISKNKHLMFTKMELDIKDSSYFFFICREDKDWRRSDYPGILWVDINNLDSLSNNFGYRYGINDIDIIIEELVEFNKTSISSIDATSIEKLVKQWKIGNVFIPYLVYIVYFDFNSFTCEGGFVEKVLLFNKTINKVMDTYSEKQFPNEKIIIRLQIEIEIDFNLLYPPPVLQTEIDFCLDTLLDLAE